MTSTDDNQFRANVDITLFVCMITTTTTIPHIIFVSFSLQVCWTTNTYYLPFSEDRIPKQGASRRYISYYQWVSLILSCQAVLFYLPRPIWRLFSKKSGIAVSTITDAAIECQRKMDADSRDKTIRYMTKHMGRYLLEMSRNELVAVRRCNSILWGIYGNYLIVLYIFIKLIYISNVVVQVLLLNVFLGMDFSWYGLSVLSRMLQGVEWTTSDRFPRVTMCDFNIRMLGNINTYTVQCSLPVNLFNEKIFIFLWFWFAFVAFATIGSLVMWLASSFCMPNQVRYIKARLITMETIRYKSKESKEVDRFVRSYLRRDGLFLIRLVSKNASDVIAAELIAGLWGHYQDHKPALDKLRRRAKLSSPESDRTIIEPENIDTVDKDNIIDEATVKFDLS